MQNITSLNINLNPNQNSKNESCIITFDKNQKNNSKYKLNNSLNRIPPKEIHYTNKK